MMLLTRTPSEAPPPVWSRARRFRAPKSIACSVTPSKLIGVRGNPAEEATVQGATGSQSLCLLALKDAHKGAEPLPPHRK